MKHEKNQRPVLQCPRVESRENQRPLHTIVNQQQFTAPNMVILLQRKALWEAQWGLKKWYKTFHTAHSNRLDHWINMSL